MDAIVTYDLTKQYGPRTVLGGLSLQVPAGIAFACVGKEHCGKTALIRLLAGLSRPSFGECSVWGYSPVFEADKLHSIMGTVLNTAKLYESLTLTENLRFFAGINGVDENDALDRISFLLHRLDIWEERDGRVEDLPTDVIRRASLARALIHRPRVLLLDEPTDGLDRETAESVQELLAHLVAQEGMTVLMCTEDMEFAEASCQRFVLLREGSLMARGDMESLRQGAGVRYRAVLRLGEGEAPPKGFRLSEGQWKREISSEEELPKIISRAVADGKKLYEARLEKPGLEEIYSAFLEGGAQRAGELDEDDEYDGPETEPAPDQTVPDSASETEAAGAEDEEPDAGTDAAQEP